MVDNSTAARSCAEHTGNITEGLKSYQVLAILGPGADIWTAVTPAWRGIFTAAAVILGFLYFIIGGISTALLVKKGSPRLPIRTFFAVYLTMSIMGFSRGILYWLDPFGMIGFIGGRVPGWLVVSRYLAVLGLPSFIASSTMIVFTLLKIMDVKQGKKWYEYWRYVILITVTPYIFAILAESLGYISTDTALVMGLICESVFVLWGGTVCIAYLTAGLSLLKKLEKSNREITEILENETIKNNQPSRLRRKQSTIYRKIFRITIGTATTGMVYTVFTGVNTIMAFLFIFHQCMGHMNKQGDSAVWLFLHIAIRVLEVILAFFILYSVTDMSTITSLLKRIRSCWKQSEENSNKKCSKQEQLDLTNLGDELDSSGQQTQLQQYKLHTQSISTSVAVAIPNSDEEMKSPSCTSVSST